MVCTCDSPGWRAPNVFHVSLHMSRTNRCQTDRKECQLSSKAVVFPRTIAICSTPPTSSNYKGPSLHTQQLTIVNNACRDCAPPASVSTTHPSANSTTSHLPARAPLAHRLPSPPTAGLHAADGLPQRCKISPSAYVPQCFSQEPRPPCRVVFRERLVLGR